MSYQLVARVKTCGARVHGEDMLAARGTEPPFHPRFPAVPLPVGAERRASRSITGGAVMAS